MDIEFWAVTLDFAGKVLVAIMALIVHIKIMKEKRIDLVVLKEIYLEEILGILGILMLVAAYILKLQII